MKVQKKFVVADIDSDDEVSSGNEYYMDSSRLGISVVVETETHRDWKILWLSRPRLIETGKFCGC